MKDQGYRKKLVVSIASVFALVVVIVGVTYAFLSVSASSNNMSGEAVGGIATLTVTKSSTSATGNLIPLDMDATTLTAAAKGFGNTGSSFDATKSCIDRSGYTVCQVYTVVLHNASNDAITFDVGVTSLTGTNTSNIEVVKMDSNVSVTNATSIKADDDGIADGVSVAAGEDKTYYLLVFIKNLTTTQTDNGGFSGTITATSSGGSNVKADFSS